MVINKDKTELYKGKIADCVRNHGKLSKSRINYLCNMHLYDTTFLIDEMVIDGTLTKIEGAVVLYDLVVDHKHGS